MKLTYDFYNRNTVEVARDLLGKKFVFGNFIGIITETEAYRNQDDEASHAFRGITKRSAIMFDEPGQAYVYLIYGMYYCLNIVTESRGEGGAVLIRGLHLPNLHLNGPGKLCRHLGITKAHNGMNLIDNDHAYLTVGTAIPELLATPRIGIKKAQDKLWRFAVHKKWAPSF